MESKRRLLTGILSALTIAGSFVAAGRAYADAPKPKIELTINAEKELNYNKPVDYSSSMISFENDASFLNKVSESEINLSDEELEEVENLMADVKSRKISSYSDFVSAARNLSENQKYAFLNAFMSSLYNFNYDLESHKESLLPQEVVFERLQNSLHLNQEDGLGTCGHMADYTMKLAEDLGITASEISGIKGKVGHAYVALKTEEGKIAFVDNYRFVETDTKNTEKAADAYQRYLGYSVLTHSFIQDGELKYQFFTKDGKNLLKFLDFDVSSDKLKDYLISGTEPSSRLSGRLKLDDYITSFDFNGLGFFANLGQIKGSNNFSLESMTLAQAGYKRKFLTPYLENDVLNALFGNKIIDAELSGAFGSLSETTAYDEARTSPLIGVTGGLTFSTNNQKGFNIGLGVGSVGSAVASEENLLKPVYTILSDVSYRAGASYKFIGEKVDVQPYLISQASNYPNDESGRVYEPKISELNPGIIVNIKSTDKFQISLEPHYTWRKWENEFGGNAEVKIGDNHVSIGGYFSKSNFEFCPDKFGLKAEAELTFRTNAKMKGLGLNVSYELEGTDYDGELDFDGKLGASLTIKN